MGIDDFYKIMKLLGKENPENSIYLSNYLRKSTKIAQNKQIWNICAN